jgi:hypothetical protein
MIEQYIEIGMLLIFFGFCFVYFWNRDNWVYYRRCKHIEEDFEGFKEVDKKFSYGDMLFKYFWVWDYNWFKERK